MTDEEKIKEDDRSKWASGDFNNTNNVEKINEKIEDFNESMARRWNIVIFNADESEK